MGPLFAAWCAAEPGPYKGRHTWRSRFCEASRREERRAASRPGHEKEKRAARQMHRRPKSREETPKEGSDSARRYRTATICDRAAQSARVFRIIIHAPAERPAEPGLQNFLFAFKTLRANAG